MMAKVSVLGDDETPLYQFLTSKSANPQIGGDIKWNFTKFLFDRNGNLWRGLSRRSLPIRRR